MALKNTKNEKSTWPPEYLKVLVESKINPQEDPSKILCDGLKRFVDPKVFSMGSVNAALKKKYGEERVKKYLTEVCDRYEESCGLVLVRNLQYWKWMRSIQDKSIQLTKLIRNGSPSEDLLLPQWCSSISPVLQQALEAMCNDLIPGDLEAVKPYRRKLASSQSGSTNGFGVAQGVSEFGVERGAVRESTIGRNRVSQLLLPTNDRPSKLESNLLSGLAKLTVADFLMALSELAHCETTKQPVFYTEELHGVNIPKRMGKGTKVGFENVLAKMIKTLTKDSFGEPNYPLVAAVLNALLGPTNGDYPFNAERVEGITA